MPSTGRSYQKYLAGLLLYPFLVDLQHILVSLSRFFLLFLQYIQIQAVFFYGTVRTMIRAENILPKTKKINVCIFLKKQIYFGVVHNVKGNHGQRMKTGAQRFNKARRE